MVSKGSLTCGSQARAYWLVIVWCHNLFMVTKGHGKQGHIALAVVLSPFSVFSGDVSTKPGVNHASRSRGLKGTLPVLARAPKEGMADLHQVWGEIIH